MLLKPFLSLCAILYIVCSLSANNTTFKKDSTRAENSYAEGIDFFRKSDYKIAIDSFFVSAQIREKLYSKKSYNYGIVQNAIGICYRNLGNLDKAIEHFLYAEEAYLIELAKNDPAIARLYNNIGNVYFNKINYGTASEYYQNAIEIYKNQQNVDKQGIADIYYNLANINFKVRNYVRALKMIEDFMSDAYSDTKMDFYSLKAAIYQELNQFNEANKSYQDAIRFAKTFYNESDINRVFIYINYCDFLIKNNRLKEAKENLDFAHDIFIKNNVTDGFDYSFYLKTVGYFYENQIVETKDITAFRYQKSSNLTEAINYYKKSLVSLGADLNNLPNGSGALTGTLSLTQFLELLKLIADNYTQISDIYVNTSDVKGAKAIHSALNYYKITTDLIQQARKEIYSDENKIQLGELEEATLFKIIQTAWKAQLKESNQEITEFAFLTAERMKASSIFDRLSDQLARENSLVPDSLNLLERNLNYTITNLNEKAYNLRRAENKDEKEIAKIDSIVFQLKKQRDELNHYLENNYGNYYEMKYANTMINIAQVRQNLKSNEVLIEYILNETDSIPELYAFFFSPQQSGFYKLDADSTFIPSLQETFRFISNPAYLFTRNDNSKAYCTSAHYLYKALLQPFTELIRNKKVFIIPDGKLNYLPFEALLTEMPDTSGLVSFNKLPYLIRNHSITYSYSANLLFKSGKQKKLAKNRLLAFAPEYNTDTFFFNKEKLVLIPLPGVQREVNLISREIKAQLFSGDEATEQNFRNESKNHDILHLAMHAFINDSLPAFSRLAFAQNGETDINNDGWLNTADIYNLDLKARLTVLSACNTGRGNLKKGEGVMSLARGFLYAGCPSIVMSLWEVEDNAGTEIMRSFYQILKKGRSTDNALRQAKLKYLENANPRLAHPHYWLGYVSIGTTEPLFRSYDFYFFGLLILALAGLAADQIIHFRKFKKKRQKKN